MWQHRNKAAAVAQNGYTNEVFDNASTNMTTSRAFSADIGNIASQNKVPHVEEGSDVVGTGNHEYTIKAHTYRAVKCSSECSFTSRGIVHRGYCIMHMPLAVVTRQIATRTCFDKRMAKNISPTCT